MDNVDKILERQTESHLAVPEEKVFSTAPDGGEHAKVAVGEVIDPAALDEMRAVAAQSQGEQAKSKTSSIHRKAGQKNKAKTRHAAGSTARIVARAVSAAARAKDAVSPETRSSQSAAGKAAAPSDSAFVHALASGFRVLAGRIKPKSTSLANAPISALALGFEQASKVVDSQLAHSFAGFAWRAAELPLTSARALLQGAFHPLRTLARFRQVPAS